MLQAFTEILTHNHQEELFYFSFILKENETGLANNLRVLFYNPTKHQIGYIRIPDFPYSKITFGEPKVSYSIKYLQFCEVENIKLTLTFNFSKHNTGKQIKWVFFGENQTVVMSWLRRLVYEKDCYRIKLSHPSKKQICQDCGQVAKQRLQKIVKGLILCEKCINYQIDQHALLQKKETVHLSSLQKIRSIYKQKECKICFERDSAMMNLQCRHALLCELCLATMVKNNNNSPAIRCPVCNAVGQYAKVIECGSTLPIYA